MELAAESAAATISCCLPETTAWPEWVCPIHGKVMQRHKSDLSCPDGHYFPVVDGIPRFVVGKNYADPFGAQWKRYRLTQLDSHTGVPITAERMRRCLGEGLWNGLRGKQVLECGCGAGRFTEVLLDRRACVTSIDLSEAVEANQENCPQSTLHRVAQADILALPFAPRRFDIVLCLGVIQFTPCPEQTIRRLYEQVRPGGWLVFDHFTHNLSWYTKTAPLVRQILRRLPGGRAIRWTERIVNLALPLHRVARKFRPAQILLSRMSPVLCYYQAYPQLSEELQRRWALLDTHNSLTGWYMHFRTAKQLSQQLRHLGLLDIRCERDGNGVEARARRPVASER
jgi:2-polyprenyl-3-methyl-5-hydroxy-6-metoxy-1,4-benzoquinol methylase